MGEQQRRALLRRHARIQYEVYLAFGELMFDRRDQLLARFDVIGIEAPERASAAGEGVMVLAPHTCAFEWAAQCVTMLHPVVSMARLHKDNPALDWIINRMRLRSGGVVYGKSDEYGILPAEGGVHTHDLHATMLHLLGIDHERLTYRYTGRDFRLTDVHGKVVREILA